MRADDLHHLLSVQDGVVSRAQVLACGGTPNDIRRRHRRREWATVVDGVYVTHTRTPTWQQRAVAGVLHAASGLDPDGHPVGAALGGHASLRAVIGPAWRHHRDDSPITVCIDASRTVRRVAGFRFVRVSGLADRVDWLRTPPRLRPEEAVLDLALAAADLLIAIGLLSDACQSRFTSAARIRAALDRRLRVPGRRALEAVLTDLAEGTCSALEHLFLTDVVRAHGLPEPERQSIRVVELPGGRQKQYRDMEWPDLDFVAELDSLLFHDNATQRGVDLDRDLDDAVDGKQSVRLGWAQATTWACRTAERLGRLLAARGWTGEVRRCPICPDS